MGRVGWGAVPLGATSKDGRAQLCGPPSLTLPHRKRGEGDLPVFQAIGRCPAAGVC
ncbi:hypothetical protein BOS5A_231330 [Bosea sp. EC-HK365B]|nr:hypothetical protein BOSE7B_50100 [Bosea sp. 7B]CAD5300357.1 hypothetical protein BOSE21B_91400 [Bosea sp. 21B]VVT62061.1 hypothetical protein BOS5A_231330 [Bosea sp. EC-HK365B]VXC97190.1 hypothetical protein BOSE127_90100 [Bosea sp. 127]